MGQVHMSRKELGLGQSWAQGSPGTVGREARSPTIVPDNKGKGPVVPRLPVPRSFTGHGVQSR